jgi:dTDP-4-dehydrorhamnose reductase
MIYISTDYVFDGLKGSPYVEGDEPNPATVYGRTKLAGEKFVAEILEDYAIVRTGWLYGSHGKSFVGQILRQVARRKKRDSSDSLEPIRVVADQFGNPTSTKELIKQIDVITSERISGLVHATCEGETSWCEFAQTVVDKMSLDTCIEPCSSSDLDRPAKRPPNVSLDNEKLNRCNSNVMQEWQVALSEFVATRGKSLLAEFGVN